ncbi:hypothetical protein [Aeromonas veronii]|uniref:hypothetical protein n=1 Tax=Aeromonas veronii TaxID=654 RepID=UPI003BA02DE9
MGVVDMNFSEKNEIITKDEVVSYKAYVAFIKRSEEIVTLREWNDTSPESGLDIERYMLEFKNLGRLGKELHNRNVPRVTERYGDTIRTHVEATYKRNVLDYAAPLCAAICVANKKTC